MSLFLSIQNYSRYIFISTILFFMFHNSNQTLPKSVLDKYKLKIDFLGLKHPSMII